VCKTSQNSTRVIKTIIFQSLHGDIIILYSQYDFDDFRKAEALLYTFH